MNKFKSPLKGALQKRRTKTEIAHSFSTKHASAEIRNPIFWSQTNVVGSPSRVPRDPGHGHLVVPAVAQYAADGITLNADV